MKVLITGGAGFIGSHVGDVFIRRGDEVRALDSLATQVHGRGTIRPAYLNPAIELIVGDVRDSAAVRSALRGVDAVIHLAAQVGVGQSMYQVCNYTDVNVLGTAVLMEALMQNPVQRLLVASSMSIYGEGLYRSSLAGFEEPPERALSDLKRGRWEVYDRTGRELEPVRTPEWKRPALSSVYALSKYDQERLCLMLGRAYDIPVTALRFFNVYGPRQALSNPYTGVLAIFAARLLNGKAPLIFEDGEQRRDFVSVHDVARACVLAFDAAESAAGGAFNIGSGGSHTVSEIARRVAQVLGRRDVEPQITGKYRVGDIRHCFADISAARAAFGYEPQVELSDGLAELAEWLSGQVAEDRVEEARQELQVRGLSV